MAKMDKKPEKPYSKPTLTIYGTVQQLTGTIGPMNLTDGGGIPGMGKTAI